MRSTSFFEPDPFKGVLGPTLAKNRPKTAKHKTKMIIFPGGLSASELSNPNQLVGLELGRDEAKGSAVRALGRG